MKTYQFMAEVADRRSKEYKALEKELDRLSSLHGKDSKQVNNFFEMTTTDNLKSLTT